MTTRLKIKNNLKIKTKNALGQNTGHLIPIYNINDKFLTNKEIPRQVYVTIVNPKKIKGPHLHFKRNGFFTCIDGNVKFVIKLKNSYKVVYSGERYKFKSVYVSKGIAVAIKCLGNKKAIVLNMPNPAWSPNMNDEHTAEFKDFKF